jgi:hypothetical protein
MKKLCIGVVGGSGAVGRAALEYLHAQQRFQLRGGYRSRAPLAVEATDALQWHAVDVEDPASLARFCAGCDIVLNTAGPSSRLGDRVARAADVAGADSVDAFGGEHLERQLARQPLSSGRRVIHSAGSFPGLSGLLPRWLAAQRFDRVHTLRAWAGGREHCTPGAGADVLLSTVQGFGRAGAAWIDGRRVAGALPAMESVQIAGFPGRVFAQPFLSQEMERVAAALNLRHAQWHNVSPSIHGTEVIGRWSGRLAAMASIDDATLAQAVNELVLTAQRDMAGGTPYYRLVLDMDGERAGQPRRQRAVLRCSDSYRLSAAMATAAVLALADDTPPEGVHCADGMLDADKVVAQLLAWHAIDAIDVVDLPLPQHAETSPLAEEGVL